MTGMNLGVLLMEEKLKKIMIASELANDPWFKNYWRNLADLLVDRHESKTGEPLVTESYDLQKRRVLH